MLKLRLAFHLPSVFDLPKRASLGERPKNANIAGFFIQLVVQERVLLSHEDTEADLVVLKGANKPSHAYGLMHSIWRSPS